MGQGALRKRAADEAELHGAAPGRYRFEQWTCSRYHLQASTLAEELFSRCISSHDQHIQWELLRRQDISRQQLELQRDHGANSGIRSVPETQGFLLRVNKAKAAPQCIPMFKTCRFSKKLWNMNVTKMPNAPMTTASP